MLKAFKGPVKPVSKLVYQTVHLSPSNVIPRNLFPGLVKEVADPMEVIELSLHEKPQDPDKAGKNGVPQRLNVHLSTSTT